MPRSIATLPVLALLLAFTPAAPVPKVADEAAYYFPTQVGAKRVYWVESRKQEVTELVEDVAVKDGEVVVTIRRIPKDALIPLEILPEREKVSVSAKGVVRIEESGQPVQPPQWLLKLPHQAGTTWNDERRGKSTYTVGAIEEVEVPAGKFKAIPVTRHWSQREVLPVLVTDWYAPGVGLVKRVQRVTVESPVLELKSFTTAEEMEKEVRKHCAVFTDKRQSESDREAAIRKLLGTGPAARYAISDLVALLNDAKTSADLQRAAVAALTGMGRWAAPAVPTLIRLLERSADRWRDQYRAAPAHRAVGSAALWLDGWDRWRQESERHRLPFNLWKNWAAPGEQTDILGALQAIGPAAGPTAEALKRYAVKVRGHWMLEKRAHNALAGKRPEDGRLSGPYVWAATEDGALASVAANWRVDGAPAQLAPRLQDSLVFNGTSHKTCTMDLAKAQTLDVQAGYRGVIIVTTAQGAPSTLEVTNWLGMAAGLYVIRSGDRGRSTIKFSGASYLNMLGGAAVGLDFELGSPTNRDVSCRIGSPESEGVVLVDSKLTNHGRTTWWAGHIVTDNAPTRIINEAGGFFLVESTGRFFDQESPDQSAGEFVNRGEVRLHTDGVRISADVRNEVGGIIRVYGRQVQLDHKAEQTAGTFELRGGEVKLAGRHPLGIRAGTISGYGTVGGNLVLGDVGGRRAAATIRPGIDGGIGTIDVKGQFHILTPDALTHVRVLNDGNHWKHSIITVGKDARLGNSILMIGNSSKWHPTAGTRHEFLTAKGGFHETKFGHRDMTYWGNWTDTGGSGKPVKWSLPPMPVGTTFYMEVVPTGTGSSDRRGGQ